MHLTLQQMKLFEAVARHRSFTRAAEELFLTQPAVSIQVKRLEDSAGIPLFELVGKRIYLTPAGREMYDACHDVLNRLEALDEEIAAMQGSVRGPLNIAVVTSGKYFMPHLLGAFLHLYPAVQPRLTVTNRARVISRLSNNEDDILIMGQVPEQFDVAAEPFLDNPLVCIAHPDHPLTQEKNISLERLLQERRLTREAGSGTRMAFDRLLAERKLTFEPYMELGSSEAIKQAVMADLGISVLSLHNMRLELAAGLIALLDVEGLPLHRRWYAVHLKSKKLPLVVKTFLDFILENSPHILENWRVNMEARFPLSKAPAKTATAQRIRKTAPK